MDWLYRYPAGAVQSNTCTRFQARCKENIPKSRRAGIFVCLSLIQTHEHSARKTHMRLLRREKLLPVQTDR